MKLVGDAVDQVRIQEQKQAPGKRLPKRREPDRPDASQARQQAPSPCPTIFGQPPPLFLRSPAAIPSALVLSMRDLSSRRYFIRASYSKRVGRQTIWTLRAKKTMKCWSRFTMLPCRLDGRVRRDVERYGEFYGVGRGGSNNM